MSILFRIITWLGLPSWVAPLAIVAIVSSGIGGAYIKGRVDSSANCREAELLARIASMERDKSISEKAAQIAQGNLKILEEEAKKQDQEIAKYEAELRNRPDKCGLTGDDVNRLRGPRGR